MYNLMLSQKLRSRIFRHLVLFFTMVLLFAWVAYSRSGDPGSFWKGYLMVFTNALFFFGYAYISVYLLIPKFLLKRRIFVFFIVFVLTGLALSLLKFIFSDYIFYQAIAPENATPGNLITLQALLVNTKDMTFIVAVFALAKFARDYYTLELNNRELQRKELEAELKLIEHQMDPHVIFNNFNSLYSISIYRPEHLKPTVKKLKAILHYLFQESKSDKVLLAKEVEMINNYIGLETLRFGDRLKVRFEPEGHMNGLKIAPLILYSFVESCFVHGAGENPRESWIRIELKVQDSRLRFVAANSVSGSPDYPDGRNDGRNENSIRRLELAYPNSHRLAIRERNNEHEVELHVSL
ncbi:MAG: histidine kinase [Bacteroidales bacterium]|nr:histidine kinase [Bacteroidales bacterium]